MIKSNNIKLGLFGFGCVGTGLYDILHKTGGIKAEVVKICVKDRNKKRSIPQELFTYDRNDLLNDESIDVIVELIDNADDAFEIVSAALRKGKAVVTANKKMIAEHFHELLQLQKQYGVPLLYEGACCASIPIIRNLEEYYDNDMLTAVEGIFNGSTNYILTRMFEDNFTFEDALLEAQLKGFAETDPSLDIEGYDPKYKLSIILAHAFGLPVEPERIFNHGIDHLSAFDLQYAREKGYRIKLVAGCRKYGDKVFATVFPKFVKPDEKLFHINKEYNAVIIEGVFSEIQFFAGKGAGSYPTGSAVLSDISALTYQYRYAYKKQQQLHLSLADDFSVEVFVSYTNNSVNLSDFLSIDEQFSSGENRYVIGRIDYATLTKSAWLKHKNVSVIFSAGNTLLPITREVSGDETTFNAASGSPAEAFDERGAELELELEDDWDGCCQQGCCF